MNPQNWKWVLCSSASLKRIIFSPTARLRSWFTCPLPVAPRQPIGVRCAAGRGRGEGLSALISGKINDVGASERSDRIGRIRGNLKDSNVGNFCRTAVTKWWVCVSSSRCWNSVYPHTYCQQQVSVCNQRPSQISLPRSKVTGVYLMFYWLRMDSFCSEYKHSSVVYTCDYDLNIKLY